ncbi:hypothetical protein [Humidesulfovibrio idahonensis]
MEFVIIWILCGIAAAYIASKKGKDGGMWFLLGILLGPFALIMIGLSPADPQKTDRRKSFHIAKSTRIDKAVAFFLAPIFVYAAAMFLVPQEIMVKAHLPITIGIFAITWLLLWRPLMRVSKPGQGPVIIPQPLTNQRVCPFCAEDIKSEAIVCKHCGRDIPAVQAPIESGQS